jgi:hypothetical protein
MMRSTAYDWALSSLARTATATAALCVGVGLAGCASQPAAPFDTLKTANSTFLRLQNYEPPTTQPGAAPGAAPAIIPGLPPEIQAWAQQAAPALQQLLPPGLLPPGLLPVPQAPAQTAQQDFRYHGRRVLGTAQVMDPKLREEIADLLGDEDNFQLEHAPCNYAEFGLGWTTQPNLPPYEILISFSCNNIQAAQGFSWPHATGIGMKPKLVESLTTVIQKLFPVTTASGPVSVIPQDRPLASR